MIALIATIPIFRPKSFSFIRMAGRLRWRPLRADAVFCDRSHKVRLTALMVFLMLVSACSIDAQPVRSLAVDSVSADIESSTFSDRIERIWISSRPLQQDNEYGFTEALNVAAGGSVYHPRLLSWSGRTKLKLRQRYVSSQRPDSKHGINEILKEYRLRVSLLKDHPARLNLYASRNISDVDGDFLEAVNVRASSLGANLVWSLGNLTQLADYSRSRYVSEGPVENDEIRRTLRYDATWRLPRFSNSARYEYSENDYVLGQRKFSSHLARYTGTLSLDDRGRQKLTSSLVYNSQKGQVGIRYVQTSISGNFALGDDLTATTSYSFRSDRVDTTRSNTNTGSFTLVHRLYLSLVTTLSGQGQVSTFQGGRQQDISPALRFNYRKRTFFGNVTLMYGLGYRDYKEDLRNLTQRRRHLEFEYRTSVPIILEQPGLDTSTIDILNLSRPDEHPQPGLDYLIEPNGGQYEISIPLISSIREGDSIRVSYTVNSKESYEFEESTRQYGIGISVTPYLDMRVGRQVSDRTLTSGSPLNPLDNVTIENASIGLRYWRLKVRGSYLLRNSIINPYKRRQVLGRFMFQLSRKFNAVLSSSYSVTDFMDTKERSEVVNVAATTWYRPRRSLTFQSRVSSINRAGRRDDGHEFVLANVARFTAQLLSVELKYDFYSRKIKVVGTEGRTFLRLIVRRKI